MGGGGVGGGPSKECSEIFVFDFSLENSGYMYGLYAKILRRYKSASTFKDA